MWIGWREVPVREQEAGDRGREAGQDPADRADGDDEREEQEQHRLEADVVADLHERET